MALRNCAGGPPAALPHHAALAWARGSGFGWVGGWGGWAGRSAGGPPCSNSPRASRGGRGGGRRWRWPCGTAPEGPPLRSLTTLIWLGHGDPGLAGLVDGGDGPVAPRGALRARTVLGPRGVDA